jgi:hypothetical protein
MLAIGVVFALIDIVFWAEGWRSWPAGLWLLVPYALALSGVEYLGIAGVIGVQPSIRAYIRFVLASAAVILPVLLAIGVLFSTPFIGRTPALLTFGVGVIAGVAFIAFLPAWPVAQSVSPKLVTPAKVFRATRGFRWGLIGAAILLSALNRQNLVPAVDKATDLSHAFAYAAGEAGMSTLSMMYSAAVAATAFVFVCRNDEDLCPPRYAMQQSAPALALKSEGRLAGSTTQQVGEARAAMFWKGTAFWVVVLVALTLLSALVPGATAVPGSIYVGGMVAVVAVFTFVNYWKRSRS